MSDTSQGPGWWLASDGKWYPPETAPPAAPSAPPTLPSTPPPSVPPPGATSWGPPPSGPGGPGGPGAGAGPVPPIPPTPAPGSGSGGRGWLIPVIVGVVAVLVIIGVGSFFFLGTSTKDDDVATATSTTVERPRGTTSSSSTTTTAESVGGMTPHRDITHGFSISTPSSWDQVSTIDSTAQDAFDALLAENPHLADAIGDIGTLAEEGLVFLALAPGGDPNVNVIVQNSPGAPASPTVAELEGAAPTAVAELQASGATVQGNDVITVNGRNVLRLQYLMPVVDGGTEQTIQGTGYLVVAWNTIYTVTVIGSPEVADQVISTFEVG